LLPQRGRDDTWSEGIDGDPLARQGSRAGVSERDDGEFAGTIGSPVGVAGTARIEAVLMILPLVPAAIIALAASWMPIITPRAFTSMILCQIASLASRNGSGLLKPALLTITLIEPNSPVHASMAALTVVRSVTSTRWKIARPWFAAAISLAAARPFASSRSATTTENPSAARPAAIARPMPLAAPVTTAPSL
jgi:hypothetical protein